MLNTHIIKSYKRLSDPEYSSEKVWQRKDYEWPGDWEGRALLALVCLNRVSEEKNEYVHEIIKDLPKYCNEDGFLGDTFISDAVNEQQLSGHGWLLRGLVEYHRLYEDEQSMLLADKIVENLFLLISDCIDNYPIDREKANVGGVSGHGTKVLDGWRVSSDVGCVFIGMDGLAEYYLEKPSDKVKALLDKLVELYCKIDKVVIRAQTHATLTGARTMIKLYRKTNDRKYYEIAEKEFENYVRNGMTATYENFNWFGREDTWTEPCAVVDSLIVALELYHESGDDKYRILARRIWFNGLSFCHRDNGGAGPNTCVTKAAPMLKVSLWEASFCCTMRYCEGLVYAQKYQSLLNFQSDAETVIESDGRAYIDDVLLVKKQGGSVVKITELEATKDSIDEEYAVFWN